MVQLLLNIQKHEPRTYQLAPPTNKSDPITQCCANRGETKNRTNNQSSGGGSSVSGWRAGCRRGPATDAAAAAAAAAAGCLSCLPEYPHSPPQLADSLFCVIGHLSPPGHMTPDYSFLP